MYWWIFKYTQYHCMWRSWCDRTWTVHSGPMFATTSAPKQTWFAHTRTHKHSYNWLPQVLANYSANCLGWQEGHLEWSGPHHFDKVFYILRKCLFYYIVIYLLFRTLRSTMFMFEGLSCHCVLFVLLCLPLCLEMVLAARYICSLLCLVGLV